LKTTAKQPGGATGKGFTPGKSGNPGGRPKSLVSAILEHRPTASKDLVAFWALVAFGTPANIKRKFGVAAKMRDRLAAAGELADRLHGRFIEQAWHVVEPFTPFVPNWHIDGIAGPRGGHARRDHRPPDQHPARLHEVAHRVGVLAGVGVDARPDLRYLCVSFDQGLSTRDNKRVRDLVSPSGIRRGGPSVQLADDQNQKTRFNTTAGGWRIATTVRGRALGEHPHRKIVDDPHNLNEAHSDSSGRWRSTSSIRRSAPAAPR
jgi:hypothetical protein